MWRFRAAWKGICPVLAVLGFGMLFLLESPAEAFWGDYDVEEPPSFFGVQLGSDIRDYPDMKTNYPHDDGVDVWYFRDSDKTAQFIGIPLQDPSLSKSNPKAWADYRTYKNKIFSIEFCISLDDFQALRWHMLATYGNERTVSYHTYEWGFYGVQVSAEGFFVGHDFEDPGVLKDYSPMTEGPRRTGAGVNLVYVTVEYLPEISKASKERYSNFKVRYRGVTLGSRARQYSFLHAYKNEPPGFVYYDSSKPAGMVRTAHVLAEKYSTYKGKIYQIEITRYLKYIPSFSDFAFSRYYNDPLDLEKFVGLKVLPDIDGNCLGDTMFYNFADKLVFTYLPVYYEAMRAKLAYYRNVKPD